MTSDDDKAYDFTKNAFFSSLLTTELSLLLADSFLWLSLRIFFYRAGREAKYLILPLRWHARDGPAGRVLLELI